MISFISFPSHHSLHQYHHTYTLQKSSQYIIDDDKRQYKYKTEKLTFSCILVNFSCGALAGATVDTILFPLDTIKTYSHSFSGVIDQN